MTTDVATDHHALHSDRSWSYVVHPGGASLFNRGRQLLDILIHETSRALADGYNCIQDAMTRYIHHAASGPEIPAEPVDLESQPANHVNRQQDMASIIESDPTPGNGDTSPSTPEADNPNDPGQLATLRDDHSDETALALSNRSWTWVVRLIVVLLLLIAAPGLILGIVTRKVAWGIAISGTFAPAVVFFGGLYYNRNS